MITETQPKPKAQLEAQPKSAAFISRLTAILVFALAAGAFALSYDALRNVAAENGVTGWRSTVWPLLVDAALIIFSLAVVRNTLSGERTRWPWFLVALYTIATVAFNILHVPGNFFRIPDAITRQIVAAVAPVSLFLAFETLMAMLIAGVRRSEAILSLAKLSAQRESMRTENETIAARLTESRRRYESFARETETLAAKHKEREAQYETFSREAAQLAAKLSAQLDERKAQYETLTRETETLAARLDERKRNSQAKAKAKANPATESPARPKPATESESETQPKPKANPATEPLTPHPETLPDWMPFVPTRQDFIAMVHRGDIALPNDLTGRELADIIGKNQRTGELWLAAARNGYTNGTNGN